MADLKFSVEEDDLLIHLIEENRTLYDPESESYKDIEARDSIWRAIANQLQKTDEECRKRWKHIRDSYNRFKRKRRCGARTRTKNSKWDFYKRLAFLEKVPLDISTEGVNDNSDSENVSSPWLTAFASSSAVPNQQLEDDDEQPAIDKSPSLLVTPLPPAAQEPRPTCRKKRKFDELLQVMKRREENRLKLMRELSQQKEESDDDDYTFSNHVRTVLKKLPPRLKIQAKKEIFDALARYEILDLDLKEEIA